MKIGIVTIYDGNNMGSFLQAVALKCILEDMNHSVVFVQRMTEEENLKMFLNRPFSKPRQFPFNYFAIFKRFICNRSEDRKRRDEIKKIYDVLSIERNYLPKVEPNDLSDIDLLICGSDEIWNFDNTSISVPFYTCQSYGENIRKIAYAVSVGTSSVKDFKKHPEIVNSISLFDKVFPRDQHSKEVLEKVLNRPLELVCDPTLLVEKKRLYAKTERLIKEPYIMVYAYDLSNEEQTKLIEFSKEQGMPIISIFHYLRIANKIVVDSPYMFENFISNAEYCYTSTFHGTIFCTLFAKRFLYHPRRLKVKEVAEYIGIEDRLWSTGDYAEFKRRMMEAVNRIEVDKKLDRIKRENLDRLSRTISNVTI